MNKIGHVRTNVYLMSLVACIIALGCYFLMFKGLGVSVPPWVKGPGSILVFAYLISLIVIHELIHIIVIKAQNWKYLSSPAKRTKPNILRAGISLFGFSIFLLGLPNCTTEDLRNGRW